jgi:hypothetical protein
MQRFASNADQAVEYGKQNLGQAVQSRCQHRRMQAVNKS